MATEPLVGVPAEYVGSVWPLVEPHVTRCYRKAREHRINAEHVLGYLLDRTLQLWLYEVEGEVKTVLITQLLKHPLAHECNVFMVSGMLPDEWPGYIRQIEDWAKLQGCTHISAEARRGFLKGIDWEERQTYCVRVL